MGKTWGFLLPRSPQTVHPHACGENGCDRATESRKGGSSPRLWGKRCADSTGWEQSRFIPTPVGKTDGAGLAGGSATVHPHACGENAAIVTSRPAACGSSPRLWGKRLNKLDRTRRDAVHPHACGENAAIVTSRPAACGSSPRLWGKRLNKLDRTRRDAVHPHACGENVDNGVQHVCFLGSSPRLWGKRLPEELEAEKGRFIPTPVGKTFLQAMGVQHESVHPHACGENRSVCQQHARFDGSSPRLWGKLFCPRDRCVVPRFIPTPVGKTCSTDAVSFSETVHPHACGENRDRR